MGNFITDTLGKIAGNVTQSVASALIVTAITTYLIVSPGKKDDEKSGAAKDSAKTSTTVSPEKEPGLTGDANRSAERTTDTGTRENVNAGKTMNEGGTTTPIAVTATEKSVAPAKTETPVTKAATKAYKELPAEKAVEEKLESTITQGRAKADSLAKAHPQDDKTKEIKKEEKKETKDVKKRSDEVFDELDQETQK